jgi:hypothetical protein
MKTRLAILAAAVLGLAAIPAEAGFGFGFSFGRGGYCPPPVYVAPAYCPPVYAAPVCTPVVAAPVVTYYPAPVVRTRVIRSYYAPAPVYTRTVHRRHY